MRWGSRSRDVLIVASDGSRDLAGLFKDAGLNPVPLDDCKAAQVYLAEVERGVMPVPLAAVIEMAPANGDGGPRHGLPSDDLMRDIRALAQGRGVKLVPVTRPPDEADDGRFGGGILRLAKELDVVGWLTSPVSRESVKRLARTLTAPRFGSGLFQFKQPIAKVPGRILGALAFAIPLTAWWLLTHLGSVNPIFLPSPESVVGDLGNLFRASFVDDILASIWRVGAAFCLASALAIPLGILMGSFAPFEAFLNPICAFFRYIPASAFIPLIILWLGIDHAQKVAVIFLGIFFYLLVLIAATVSEVPREFIETAYTLGASRRQVLLRVVSPAALPGILENLRAMVGAAWTYLVVAELIAAQKGIGYRILQAERFLQTGRVIGGILTIGVIGILTDLGFRALIRYRSPWRA